MLRKELEYYKLNFFKYNLCLIFLIFFILGIKQEFYLFPVWDTFDVILILSKYLNKEISFIKYILTPHNEHIIAFNRIAFLIDKLYFNSSFIFLYFVNTSIILLSFLIMVNSLMKLTKLGFANNYFCWLITCSFILFFNWYQKENFVQVMQMQFNFSYLFMFLVVNFFFDYFDLKKKKYLFISLFFFLISCFVSTHGQFLILFFFFICIYTKSYRLFLVCFAIFGLVFFLKNYIFEPSLISSNLINNLKLIFNSTAGINNFFASLFFLLGSYITKLDPSSLSKISYVYGLTIFILVIFININFINKSKHCSLNLKFIISFINFLFFFSLLLVYSRFNHGIYIFTSSRYATSSIILFIFILSYLILNFKNKYFLEIFKILSVIFFIILFNNQLSATKEPNWKPRSEIAMIDIYVNIYDENSLKYIYLNSRTSFEHVKKIIDDRTFLSPHKQKFKKLISEIDNSNDKKEDIRKLKLNKCIGSIESYDFGNDKLVKINGWVYNEATKEVPQFAYILSENRLFGFVLTGQLKKHYKLKENLHINDTKKSGFIGYLNKNFENKNFEFWCK